MEGMCRGWESWQTETAQGMPQICEGAEEQLAALGSDIFPSRWLLQREPVPRLQGLRLLRDVHLGQEEGGPLLPLTSHLFQLSDVYC